MKKITKKLVITVLAAALVLSSTAVAFASGEIFPGSRSKGTFQFAEDGDASNPDIVISSDDLGLIYGNVTDGKTALASVINDATADSKQPTSLGTTPANLPTFEDLQNAIDAVKSAGEDKAYKDIKDSFASDPDKADIYAGVEDLESLKNAITEDNNNSKSSNLLYRGFGATKAVSGYDFYIAVCTNTAGSISVTDGDASCVCVGTSSQQGTSSDPHTSSMYLITPTNRNNYLILRFGAAYYNVSGFMYE